MNRNDASNPMRTATARRRMFLRTAVRWVLPVAWLATLAATFVTFFALRGPWDFTQVLDAQNFGITFFPLAGLVAFTLVWSQTIIGANLWWLRSVFPGVVRFHRTQGPFALLFALLHPLLLFLGVGLASYLSREYVPKTLAPFVWIGYVQLLLLVLTAGTAMLRRLAFVRGFWRRLHCANYAVFALAWIHSWFLGTDVQPTALRYVWIFFAATAALSIAGSVLTARRAGAAQKPSSAAAPEGFTAVGALADFAEERTYCVAVGASSAVLVRRGRNVFALHNVCTHAGGPLCEGAYDSGIIECPWHASKFRMADGTVVAGPARHPQPQYESRVQDGIVYLKLVPRG